MIMRIFAALALAAVAGCSGGAAAGSGSTGGATSTGSTGTRGGSTTSTGGSSGSSGSAPMGATVTFQGSTQLFDIGSSVSFNEDINTGTQYLTVDASQVLNMYISPLHFHLYAVLPGNQTSPYQLSYGATDTQGSQITFDVAVDGGIGTKTCSDYTLNLESASTNMGESHAQGTFSGNLDDGGAFSGTIHL